MTPLTTPAPVPAAAQGPAAAMATHASSAIGALINVATRRQHTELNRSLVQRLPLALPPHQTNPLLFAKGIVPFASFFFLFETEWDLLVRQLQQRASEDATHDHDLHVWLANLRPRGLARSSRFNHDLKHLRAVAGPNIYSTPDLDEEWTAQMRTRIRSKPHILIAFAWVFYMATFAGGRWIRQQLATSGREFWLTGSTICQVAGSDKPSLEVPGFSFLSFDGDQDGEDIKTLFKASLIRGESILTPDQQQDILDTAQQLFELCNSLVGQLDQMVARERMLGWVASIIFVLLVFIVFLAWRTSYFPHHS
ncbi:hypothetical protein CB0940_02782 [Cercospora beticola]|uniref:Heme-binding protein HMX1 n=1 Tax=Cercospora beticola TaxID=122368 RepID=A0A2G5I4E7_CERBT|nr:hypothetical protein CB0940_02782 [Cercospora beticola]PIA99650.1 hypothetical protein CB0940_02782 [Cercospora beticola]WPA99930.1 hypothetical protein RHO25_004550 [Cercospora beticola]CAK1361897.1 unnamed protein product [Cercospora beticola]